MNIAVTPLPELPLRLHKFHLCAIRRNQRKDTLEKSILWIFKDLARVAESKESKPGSSTSIKVILRCRFEFNLKMFQTF